MGNTACRYMDEEDPKAMDGQADLPEERLAFALGDGRVGVLAVKGRKVISRGPTSLYTSLTICICCQAEIRSRSS